MSNSSSNSRSKSLANTFAAAAAAEEAEMLLRAWRSVDCNFRLSHLSKWKFMQLAHFWFPASTRTIRQFCSYHLPTHLPAYPPSHLPTCSFARLTVWVVNALFTLECLMKESLHSFIRSSIRWFVHSFALFPDSFMRTRVLCSFYPAPN